MAEHLPTPDSDIRIAAATASDVTLILDLIRGLAEYEREPEAVVATEDMLRLALFGERPAAEAAIAYYNEEPAGLALWFQSFSTWTGRSGLWLEDLFVKPAYRRKGIGRAFLGYLARLAKSRGYGRIEWSVLDWNKQAIDFYRAIGAKVMDEWTTNRLSGADIDRLASLDD